MTQTIAAITCILISLAINSQAEIFKWIDHEGRTHYSSKKHKGIALKHEKHSGDKKVLNDKELSIPVNVFIHRKSKWSIPEVKDHIKSASDFYKKNCGVSLDISEVKTGNIDGLYEYESWRSDYKFSYLNPDPKNSIFFIFTGKEKSLNKTGYAWFKSARGRHPSVQNTIYMFEMAIGHL